jgi:ribosomal RNA-processing protein 36
MVSITEITTSDSEDSNSSSSSYRSDDNDDDDVGTKGNVRADQKLPSSNRQRFQRNSTDNSDDEISATYSSNQMNLVKTSHRRSMSNQDIENEDDEDATTSSSSNNNSYGGGDDDTARSSDDDSSSNDEEAMDDDNEDEKDEEDMRHLPLGERLRRNVEQGNTSVEWKIQRRERYEKSAQFVHSVKQQMLEARDGHKNNNDIQRSSSKNKAKGETNTASIKSENGKQSNSQGKKKSKHAPTEASSKRSDFYLRQRLEIQSGGCSAIGTSVNVHTHRYKPRDPRMDPTTSTDNQANLDTKRGGKQLWQTIKNSTMSNHEDYAFIQDIRKTEIASIQKRIKARQMTGTKGQEHRKRYGVHCDDDDGLVHDQSELHRLLQEKAAYERNQFDISAKRAVQQTLVSKTHKDSQVNDNSMKTSDNVNRPQSRYVPKQRELKRMYMEAKYDLLQQQGGNHAIDKVITKRRKKNKSKDAKMPML